MSSYSLAYDSVGLILSQGACLTQDQGQMMGSELGVMEMSEIEYTHLQYLIHSHMEAQVAPPDEGAGYHPAAAMVDDNTEFSPVTASQAIDLSTSNEDHCPVMPGEKTPASYGEVPAFVLARVRCDDSPTEPCGHSSTCSQKRPRSSVRVCLEKRFNNTPADALRQQDLQSAVRSNFAMLQQSAEAQETVVHPQMQKWMKSDRASPYDVPTSFVANMCEQVIGHLPHMVEPKHQGLIIPKGFPFNFRPESVVTKAHHASDGKATEEQQLEPSDVTTPAAAPRKPGSDCSSQPVEAAKVGPDAAAESRISSRKKAPSHASVSQRRERHNSKERERRKRIRLCCDELNMLVPFCESDTDKVTTLKWTTAFLRYINKTYGDALKEEFQKAFNEDKGLLLKSSSSSDQDPIHREMDETLSIPLAVEQ